MNRAESPHSSKNDKDGTFSFLKLSDEGGGADGQHGPTEAHGIRLSSTTPMSFRNEERVQEIEPGNDYDGSAFERHPNVEGLGGSSSGHSTLLVGSG